MSDSMNPVFKKNDIIIIQEQNEYKVGDIVAYIADDGNIVTHRIIEKNENEGGGQAVLGRQDSLTTS